MEIPRLITGLSISELVLQDLPKNLINLAAYAVGMVLYAVVIWHFYRNLSKKDLFPIDIKQPKKGFFAFLSTIWDLFTFALKSLFIFPVISAFWFLILGSFLLFLSKSHNVGQILLMSITIILAARITAHFNEDLSKDLAKLIPFALLGVFIVDTTYFSIDATLERFYSIPGYIHVILQYTLVLVILEVTLAIYQKIKSLSSKEVA